MPHTTVSHVSRVTQAHAISDDLHAAGFQSSTISVVFPHHQCDNLMRAASEEHLRHGGNSHSRIADVDGPVMGNVATTPGRANCYLATGPIQTLLSGIRLRGTEDALPNALIGLGLPDLDAQHFAAAAEAGNALIIVRTDEEICALLVVETFRHHGGREIVQFAWPA